MSYRSTEEALADVLEQASRVPRAQKCALLDNLLTAAEFFLLGQRHGYEAGYEAGRTRASEQDSAQ